jgi:hypothetical protein
MPLALSDSQLLIFSLSDLLTFLLSPPPDLRRKNTRGVYRPPGTKNTSRPIIYLPIPFQYCILARKCSESKIQKAFSVLKKIRNRKMRSFLEHYPQFLTACNWKRSCNQNPGAISFLDSPQGGEPMK